MGKQAKERQVGRLAMREEGTMWNAYYARPDTMEGAVMLGGIAIRFVNQPGMQWRKDAFMLLMREALTELVFEETGQEIHWPADPQPAPESERGGTA